jgi:hypothetical protein
MFMMLPTLYNIANFAVDIGMLRFLKKTIMPNMKQLKINSVSGNLKTGQNSRSDKLSLEHLITEVKP